MNRAGASDPLKTFGGRLKSALKDADLRQKDIADLFGITEQAVSQWFRNESQPEKAKIFQLAEFLKVSPDWLLNAKGPRQGSKEIGARGQEFVEIGRFDTAFSMGPGSLISDDPEPQGYWMVETQWLRAISRAAPAELAIVRCSGDSMERTLFDGDWVLVDRTQTRLSREGIYAIRVGSDAWIKRVSPNIKTKKIRVLSDNPTTPPQPDVDEEDLAVIGRVVALVARKVP